MNKRVVVLRGIGGNFKSSVARALIRDNYMLIPEGNREFDEMFEEDFNRNSDPELNYTLKRLLFKSFLRNQNTNFISDRGLVDYAMMNEFIKKYIWQYRSSMSEHLNVQKAFCEECELLNGYQVINILLTTEDKNFIKHIIDDGFDVRACFYEDTETYLKCQEMYKEFVLNKYHNVVHIRLTDIPVSELYSDTMNAFVEKLVNDVKNRISLYD